MITAYDNGIIAFYLLFILAIGLAFRRMSKNTSDYFRAGGAMPWWITGTSAWIAGFSAWTFTGAAGMIYETGTVVLCLYYSAMIAFVLVYFFTCTRFRRMRVVSWMEAVRLRYGAGSEQFYTWIKVPLLLFGSGVGLNAIGVFISSVFRVDMNSTLIVLGVVVTVVAVTGGAWAVLASDFVQMLLVMTITILAALLTLRLPQIGGLSGLIAQVKVPLSPAHWGQLASLPTVLVWSLGTLWLQIVAYNNMEAAPMYLMSRSDRDAKRMVLIPMIGSLIGPLIWLVPALGASILHPNLAAEFPALKQPHEAAFVAMCLQVMPRGMMGLLICAMLGATLTSMDAGLNKTVGIVVRSFYLPIVDPQCPEKKLLIISKLCTVGCGVLIVGCALLVNLWRTTNLFDYVNQFSASLTIPLAYPLLFGLFYKKTPGWSAWSTGLIGMVVGLGCNFWLSNHLQDFVGALSSRERTNLLFGCTLFSTLCAAGGWYFFTTLFYQSASGEYRENVERFFTRLRTPVAKEGVEDVQERIYRLLGILCLIYGTFVLLLILIPNLFVGRLCFVFCGGSIFAMGAVLYGISRRMESRIAAHLTSPAD
jgi:SSS family solute:Na+ symporter